MTAVRFEIAALRMRYGTLDVLDGLTLVFDEPGMVALTGPNGAGKSTLLSIMAGLRRPSSGRCLLNGVPVQDWRRRDFARLVSLVPQNLKIDFPFTAEQVVLMGRTPYAGGLFESSEDWQEVRRAMALTDVSPFASRDFRALSGGERQRVILAAALAQKPSALLLDEPTAYLDLKHQLSIYSLLRDLARGGMLVIAVTHDLNLAASYSDRVVVLDHGRLAADSGPCDALTPERIRSVFGVESAWLRAPDGRSWIAYGQ